MGVEQEKSAVYGHLFSTVVPGDVTDDAVVHEFADMDLVMKLHYLRAVYYFRQSDGLAINVLKKPMFPWLNVLYPLAGRIRRDEAGRPFIKCNDCGLRIVEASCSKTLEEWLDVEDDSRWRNLVPEKVLGPELPFSPSVFIQVTISSFSLLLANRLRPSNKKRHLDLNTLCHYFALPFAELSLA